MTKRWFDLVFALVALVLALPLMFLAALLVKVSSRGPVLFRQKRVGRNFEPFEIFKFRTMVHDASSRGGLLTVGSDPRVTRPGWWLRMAKVDELPQLFNVLRGDMSLVGPRPEVEEYVSLFRLDYEEILTVRPGVTDLASIRFRDEELVLGASDDPAGTYVTKILPLKIQLAREYVQRSSFLFDLGIIIRTVAQIFLRGGSADLAAATAGSQSRARSVVYMRRAAVVIVQLGVVALANYTAFSLRFDGDPPDWALRSFWLMVPALIAIRGVTFIPFHLYQGLWQFTSVYDLLGLVGAIGSSSLIFMVLVQGLLGPGLYPRSVVLIDAVLATILLGGMRVARRTYVEMMQTPTPGRRILIYGAGTVGEQTVREMKHNRALGYRPIGFIDDDPNKTGQRIHGVRVLGTRDDLDKVISRHGPSAVVVAMSDAAPEILRTIVKTLEPFNISIKTLPNLRDVIDGRVHVERIRNLAVEDLLTRAPVGLDQAFVRHLIRGRCVMVTGAGGSIGSELCRQVLSFGPEALVLFERYENGLYSVGLELKERGTDTKVYPVLGDVTDEVIVTSTLKTYRPVIVFHAAAHKHVPVMEDNPCEAVKNNVRGTRILAEACERGGVGRFILISTDKAANPTSVMGASKRVAELIVQALAVGSSTSYSIVRFGNVLGSKGSVVPRFLEQINRGGPLTVTHPDVKRFFMLIPEAVQLVLQAAATAANGATYVLDMGEQIMVVELARDLIRLAGFVPERDMGIEFIGLRPGEKLEEELVGRDEELKSSGIQKVLSVVSRRRPDTEMAERIRELEEMAATGDHLGVGLRLRALAAAHPIETLELDALGVVEEHGIDPAEAQ